jgi:threonine dehydratase
MTPTEKSAAYPITFDDVLAARERIRPFLAPTPLRSYAALDAAVGHGIRALVKHENHQPTNAFKVRNALSAMTLLDAGQRGRGVVAATRGNHGLGVAFAARRLGMAATICVPVDNNAEKNEAMRGLGAELIEEGRDFDEALALAVRLAGERGLHMVHSTNDPAVIAGAATMTLEMLEQVGLREGDPTGGPAAGSASKPGDNPGGDPAGNRVGDLTGDTGEIDALVMAVGGGSQAVGALVVAGHLRPGLEVFGVQAAGAPAMYDSWRLRRPAPAGSAETFADGLATRACYEMTFGALCGGLADFVVADEAELAAAVRTMVRTTHNLAEGAGAASLAGLVRLAPRLAGRRVAIVLSGSNIDQATLRLVLDPDHDFRSSASRAPRDP